MQFGFWRAAAFVSSPIHFLVQEAQLSQRDRATICVIEYFANSLKVIRNDTVE